MFIKKRTIQLFFVSVTLVLAANVSALGLSEIELNSYLNQKLDANIPFTELAESELVSLDVSVSSDLSGSQQLKHRVMSTEHGHVLNISSRDVIKEPVVNLRLDINWQEGRLVREYTLLIDPPGN